MRKIAIVASGTSYYGGLVGKYMIESRFIGRSQYASEFRYYNPIIEAQRRYRSPSRANGNTLAATELARRMGAALSIVT